MVKFLEKIPEQYRDEFLSQQTAFIKSRVSLFCILAISIYFFASLMGLVINPSEYKVIELIIGVILIIISAFILYFNRKVRTFNATKFNAYLFTALLLALIVRLSIAYADVPMASASIFVFALFVVSITIPWIPIEIIPIWIMHIIAFTAAFLAIKYLPGVAGEDFNLREYLDGVLFLGMAFWICIVVRKKETTREVDNFVLLKEVQNTRNRRFYIH